MKEGIHPKYTECAVTCGCGATFTTRSTISPISVEICSVNVVEHENYRT